MEAQPRARKRGMVAAMTFFRLPSSARFCSVLRKGTVGGVREGFSKVRFARVSESEGEGAVRYAQRRKK